MVETAAVSQEHPYSPVARRTVLIAAILASSMGFIDGSVMSIAIPAIRADLGATLADAQWISNGYMLLLSSLILLGGAAGDRFGLRKTFGLGIVVFVAASMVCALAPTPAVLIGARVVQGAGAAFMVPGSLAIIAKAYPRDERGKAIGIWAAASSLTSIGGPIVGGLILTLFGDWSWRLVFAINLPLGGIALALLWYKVPADHAEAGRKLDAIGAVLATAALMLIAFGLTGSDGVPPLSHMAAYSGAGLVVAIAFIVWEAQTQTPMLPLRLFSQKAFSGANGLTFALYFALAGTMFFLPMTMIGGWGVTPADVALAMLPMGVLLTVLSSFTGALADRYGPAPLIAGGSVIVALAFAVLGLTTPLHDVWFAVLPSIGLLGLGMGLVVSPLSTAVMTAVDDSDTGIASGVNNAVARVAALMAVALLGLVVASVFERALGSAAELPIFFGLATEGLAPAEDAARVAATDAAFAAVAYITAGLSLVSAVIAWLTLEHKRPAASA
ncbi:MFS transporter [Devosia limi DSM 17137]|uniref:Drug resistance transporter, EmrB/QacA subfamily n=1 Tax=Devosia limi DSM 17137 TaxID=1121477 RepID=A0A0F5LNE6_9HYPH|nr:MFS transporter [Devosia limi]KKB83848.1 MFS transporter [Devosia limi DSM 17137]SHF96673.1 drug resistance transporter, EmrB/QacA subfamily [Devosia limi DSM 17137]